MALLCERRYECSEAVTVLAVHDEVLVEIDDKGAPKWDGRNAARSMGGLRA